MMNGAKWQKGTILLIALLAFSPMVQAESRLSARYEVDWNGFTVAESHVEVLIGADSYDLEVRSRTTGLARLFAGGHGRLSSQGTMDLEQIKPIRYVSEGEWDGEAYYRRLEFDAVGRLSEMEDRWPEKWLKEDKREPVPNDLQFGPDPLSLALIMSKAGLNEETTFRAFDGDSVTDFTLKCEATPADQDDQFVKLGTEIISCGVDAKAVAGQRIDDGKAEKKARLKRNKSKRRGPTRRVEQQAGDDALEDMANKSQLILYLARLENDHFLPIRIEARGGVVVELAELMLDASPVYSR